MEGFKFLVRDFLEQGAPPPLGRFCAVLDKATIRPFWMPKPPVFIDFSCISSLETAVFHKNFLAFEAFWLFLATYSGRHLGLAARRSAAAAAAAAAAGGRGLGGVAGGRLHHRHKAHTAAALGALGSTAAAGLSRAAALLGSREIHRKSQVPR